MRLAALRLLNWCGDRWSPGELRRTVMASPDGEWSSFLQREICGDEPSPPHQITHD